MSLFQWGHFNLHSGDKTWWRIDCDALSDSEIELFAKMISEKVGRFNSVVSPSSHPGSSVHKLKDALKPYCDPRVSDPGIIYLIVDDVMTTGVSMTEVFGQISPHAAVVKGAVMFQRGSVDIDWIKSIFKLNYD